MAILATAAAVTSIVSAAFNGLQKAAAKPNDLSSSAVANTQSVIKADVKEEVEKTLAMTPSGGKDIAIVATKSAWLSKINWTQAIALLASVLVYVGIDLDLQTQLAIIAAIQAGQAVLTWILKTFFTDTVTPSSLPAKQ